MNIDEFFKELKEVMTSDWCDISDKIVECSDGDMEIDAIDPINLNKFLEDMLIRNGINILNY